MEKELKQIVENCGKEVFQNADQLMQLMQQAGCAEKNILIAGLILKACPSVGNILQQGKVTQSETNVLLSTVVTATGLSGYTVRMYIGAFLRACGVQGMWNPRLMVYDAQSNARLRPMTVEEDETVEDLMKRLAEDEERAAVIHDLDVLSKGGNVRASYELGKFYKDIDEKFHTEKGKVFFQRAAKQGYGPANGALAHYAACGERKDLAKAAKFFENPTSISGSDGREWSALSEQLLKYLEENSLRVGKVLTLQIWSLVATVAALILAATQFTVWGILAVLVQLAGLGWTLFSKFVRPFNSCRLACYGVVLGWILLILSVL